MRYTQPEWKGGLSHFDKKDEFPKIANYFNFYPGGSKISQRVWSKILGSKLGQTLIPIFRACFVKPYKRNAIRSLVRSQH